MSQAALQLTPEQRKQRADRRALVATLLTTSLIALAYQEAVTPVRDSVRASGVTFGTSVLFLVFFLTSIRFFIGNYLHMQILAESDLPGGVWLYDLLWIVAQTVLFIFLGGVCSVELSSKLEIHFVALLLIVYSLDVIWILTQWVIGCLRTSWKRKSYPWAWLLLNIAQVALIWGLGAFAFGGNNYSKGMLWWLASVSTVAFIIDVILVDRSGLLW